MTREIKRYESRKLYDTEESRYVALDEIADWVRSGQDVRVIDNATSDDVTAQTLAQVILEEGRSGRSRLPSELLHDLIRQGEQALTTGAVQVRLGVNRFLQASADRVTPLREAREEMQSLRSRLDELETSLASLERPESTPGTANEPTPDRATRQPTARKAASKKPVSKKPVSKKPVSKKPVSNKAASHKPISRKPAAKKAQSKKPARKGTARKTV